MGEPTDIFGNLRAYANLRPCAGYACMGESSPNRFNLQYHRPRFPLRSSLPSFSFIK